VPVHTVAVIGTTDEKVTDPEMLRIRAVGSRVDAGEGDKAGAGLSRARILRAWAGVRPLYQEGYSGDSRDATRALTLLDHQARDGVSGFLTITGGKWTTFRLMAEKTVDMACAAAGRQPPCPPQIHLCRVWSRGTTGWVIACTRWRRSGCRANWSASVSW
jgi:glycerol-3-phosphate dehydrogenase